MFALALRVLGQHELKRAMAMFQRELGKSAKDAVKFAGYQVARSLGARTLVAKKGPKIRLGTESDFVFLADNMRKPPSWPNEATWRNATRHMAHKAYVAVSDRPRDKEQRGGLRHMDYWRRDKVSKEEIKKQTQYGRRGLAKASWKWMEKKAKAGVSAFSGSREEAEARGMTVEIPKGSHVRIDPDTNTLHISNCLKYIRSALKSPTAVEEAIRAGAAAMRQYVYRKLGATKSA